MIRVRSALAAVAVVVSAGLLAAPGQAASQEDNVVSWSVQPATAKGPTGRAWIELDADPGDTFTQHLAVRLYGSKPQTFRLSAADGYLTPKGRFNMLTADKKSVDAGTWITVAPSVDVAAGQTVVVPFTIKVPKDAAPGDHPAGIAASITSSGGGNVGVESRVGFRVMLRVSGEVRATVAVRSVDISYEPSWNPFAPGAMRVSYDVVNTGNVRVAAGTVVSVGGRNVGRDLPEVMPGGTRAVTTSIDGIWPTGRVTAKIVATPKAVASATSPLSGVRSASAAASVWAFPWPQALLLALVLLLGWGVFDERRRRRRRMDAKLARAREEGRAAALAGAATGPAGPAAATGSAGPAAATAPTEPEAPNAPEAREELAGE